MGFVEAMLMDGTGLKVHREWEQLEKQRQRLACN
jgi:hypothetical protein